MTLPLAFLAVFAAGAVVGALALVIVTAGLDALVDDHDAQRRAALATLQLASRRRDTEPGA